MTASSIGVPEVAEVITTALRLYMTGSPRHSDLGTHMAIVLADHFRIETRHKSRRNAA